jgi:hypothetical protein
VRQRELALRAALGASGAVSSSRERHRARNVLVVIKLAIALVLLVGSDLKRR